MCNLRRIASLALVVVLATGCTKSVKPITLDLAADGSLTLNGESITMSDAMTAMGQKDDSRQVTVRIDPDVPYRYVDALQNELQEHNVKRIVVTASE